MCCPAHQRTKSRFGLSEHRFQKHSSNLEKARHSQKYRPSLSWSVAKHVLTPVFTITKPTGPVFPVFSLALCQHRNQFFPMHSPTIDQQNSPGRLDMQKNQSDLVMACQQGTMPDTGKSEKNWKLLTEGKKQNS